MKPDPRETFIDPTARAGTRIDPARRTDEETDESLCIGVDVRRTRAGAKRNPFAVSGRVGCSLKAPFSTEKNSTSRIILKNIFRNISFP
jgi:hypothetical protein